MASSRRGMHGQRVDACLRCGIGFRTAVTRCEKTCPNCGWRASCHD